MNKETLGTVISVKKQWWLKINTKPIRTHILDGAIFPHIIKVEYTVSGTKYTKLKWVKARFKAPNVGDKLTVIYDEGKPEKSKVILRLFNIKQGSFDLSQ